MSRIKEFIMTQRILSVRTTCMKQRYSVNGLKNGHTGRKNNIVPDPNLCEVCDTIVQIDQCVISSYTSHRRKIYHKLCAKRVNLI